MPQERLSRDNTILGNLMRIIFWNTHNNKRINDHIIHLIDEYHADVCILSEYSDNAEKLSKGMFNTQNYLLECNTIGCDRIHIWSKACCDAGTQSSYYSIQLLDKSYILCSVHLPSQMYRDEDSRSAIIETIIGDINQLRDKTSIDEVIIVGDMNDMPYSKGCFSVNCFNALPFVENGVLSRKFNKIDYHSYYNPTWNLFGDSTYPPGTYYYKNSNIIDPQWYMMDQVIVSNELSSRFNKDSLKIVTSCGGMNLFDKHMHPDVKISDHFPLFFEIKDKV